MKDQIKLIRHVGHLLPITWVMTYPRQLNYVSTSLRVLRDLQCYALRYQFLLHAELCISVNSIEIARVRVSLIHCGVERVNSIRR
jgi:hypothetical protein